MMQSSARAMIGVVLVASLLILAGCSSKSADIGTRVASDPDSAAQVRPDPNPQPGVSEAADDEAKNGPKILSPEQPPAAGDAKPASGENQADGKKSGSDSAKEPADKAPAKSETDKPAMRPFDPAHPSLLGCRIGDSADEIVNRFGKPKETEDLTIPGDPIRVYAYSGFEIGFDKNNRLKYVQVHSRDVDPGLNGLRLHDSAEDAVRLLGKPDVNSGYVLNYEGGASILKMDVDPADQTILSIKLFSSED